MKLQQEKEIAYDEVWRKGKDGSMILASRVAAESEPEPEPEPDDIIARLERRVADLEDEIREIKTQKL